MSPAAASSGYSGTPLPQKLGLKDGQAVLFVDLPKHLDWLKGAASFRKLAESGIARVRRAGRGFDFIHVFTSSRNDLAKFIQPLMDAIVREGMIWISWPKKASGVPTDITEDVIREVVLPIGLVDVKVAAVDEIWSSLKLVIRKELR
jgi:hypothetical protein